MLSTPRFVARSSAGEHEEDKWSCGLLRCRETSAGLAQKKRRCGWKDGKADTNKVPEMLADEWLPSLAGAHRVEAGSPWLLVVKQHRTVGICCRSIKVVLVVLL